MRKKKNGFVIKVVAILYEEKGIEVFFVGEMVSRVFPY